MNIQELRNLAAIDRELREIEAVLVKLRCQSNVVDENINVKGVAVLVDRAALIAWLEARRAVLKATLTVGGITQAPNT